MPAAFEHRGSVITTPVVEDVVALLLPQVPIQDLLGIAGQEEDGHRGAGGLGGVGDQVAARLDESG